jgi:hypothetical protein
MAKTRLISPGSIPNHRLLKNLQLNDHYISNDGEDEGISIDDSGKVGIGQASPTALLEVEQGASGGVTAFKVDNNDTDEIAIEIEAANIDENVIEIVANGLTTGDVFNIQAFGLTTGNMIHATAAQILPDGGSATTYNCGVSNSGTGDQTAQGLLLDYNKTGITASGKTANVTGIHLDMDDTATNVGAVNMTGLDVDLTFANTGGTVTNTGININVTGADAEGNVPLVIAGGPIKIREQAATPSASGVDTYGFLWVNNTDPTVLMFTDDDGNDIQITSSGGLLHTSGAVAADNITEGSTGAVSIGTDAAEDITFTDKNSAEWLVFKTSDVADGSNVPVTEIMGKDDQRLRLRARGAAHDLQLVSERNIELCVVKNALANNTAPVVALHDLTPTAAEETLSGAWEINQDMGDVDLTQLADQTAPAAQFRGSTAGSKLVLNYSTDGSGNPTFGTAIPHGGTAYRNKVRISGASYNNGSAIAHTANDDLAQYMSVKGTGIPTGAYIGSITNNTNFVIHFEGSTVNTTGGSLSGQVLFARERVVFQDGGNQSTYAIIEIEEAASGNIYIGNSTGANQVGGSIQNMNGVITTDVNKVANGLGIFATAGDLKLGSYGISNISLTTEFDTIWLSNDSTDHGLPGYTNVCLGQRAFVGNASCLLNRMRFDGDDDNRIIQIAANDVDLDDGLDSAAWATGAGFKIQVAKTTGVTELSATGSGGTAGNMTIFPEGTLVLKQTTAAADISIQANRTLELIPGGGTQSGAVSIDKNSTITATGTTKALHIDYDHTGISAAFQTVTGIGLDLDMNCESVTHIGTVHQIGIDIDVIGGTSGLQKNIGIDIAVSGADFNYALITSGGNVGIGTTAPDMALEINQASGNCLRLTHNDANGSASQYADITVADDGHLELATTGTDGDITLDSASDIILDPNSGITKFYVAGDTDDLCTLTVAANGATTLATADSDGAVAHLSLDVDGHVEFDGCAVGFDREEETFSGDDLLASGSGTGGTEDTHIDFRIGNKIYLQQTASMDQINLIFPNTSGNFLLYIRYDGDWSIGDWKVWASDLTAPTITDVTWPGGTQPDNTASGRDIFSFYWDYGTETCFGVASLAFAQPS